jgi:lipopolysaccharide export system permease protein
MLPSFILGNLIFLFILLMFQALRLTEFVLVHGVQITTILKIMSFLSISFLPMILPMSLLFSILLTYGRLSSDSEIVALKSLGLNIYHIALPGLLLASLTCVLSAQTSFYLAPWGNRQFELLINELGRLKASATLKEGVFSEGFFDLVIYANKVDSKNGILDNVFIYDERDPNAPLTIIAKTGRILSKVTKDGHLGLLRLIGGNIHRTQGDTYTKVDFNSYDINLFDPAEVKRKNKSFPSYTIDEIRNKLKDPRLEGEKKVKFQIEYHTRWSLSMACLIFGLLGVGLGTTTNRRAARGSGFVLSIVVVIAYWVCYVVFENLAKKEIYPAWLSIWLVDAIFLYAGVKFLRRAQN